MATFTVAIPEDLKRKIDSHPEVNWPEYIKQRFEIKISELKRFEELKNKGGL